MTVRVGTNGFGRIGRLAYARSARSTWVAWCENEWGYSTRVADLAPTSCG